MAQNEAVTYLTFIKDQKVKMLLLLSRFSRVRLCATSELAAHQAPLSLGFSRQEHWSGLPFPSPMQKSESEVAQSCPTLSDPMDCSLPGSSVHGIFQATVLEWGAIALYFQMNIDSFEIVSWESYAVILIMLLLLQMICGCPVLHIC